MDPSQQGQAAASPEHAQPGKKGPYKRTSGAATGRGEDFEKLMIALVYLRARRLLGSFSLTVNDESCGSFDDIVLRYGQKEVMVQLKSRDKNITKNMLKSPEGDYSLNKHFLTVKDKDWLSGAGNRDILLVMFSDQAFCVQRSLPVTNIDPLLVSLIGTQVADPAQQDKDRVFKVDLDDEVCTPFNNEPNAADFVNKMYFFSKQTCVDALDEIIKQEFIKHARRIVPQYNDLRMAYHSKIKKYWQGKRKSDKQPLTESWGDWDEIQDLLKRNEGSLSGIAFEHHVLSKCSSMLLNTSQQKIHVICKDYFPLLRSIKINQAFQASEYERYLFTSLDEPLTDLQAVIRLWKTNASYDTLVIDQGENAGNVQIPEEVFQTSSKKKLIFISNEKTRIADVCSRNLCNSWLEIRDKFSFQDLTLQSQKTVLDREVTLQGVNVKLSDLHVKEALVGDILALALADKHLQLGRKLKDPDVTYIHRSLHKEVAINEDILKITDEISDKFYVSGISQHILFAKIKKHKGRIELFEALSDWKVPLRNSEHPVHVLEFTDEEFFWKYSTGDTHNLSPYLVYTEKEKEDVEEFMNKCQRSSLGEDELIAAQLKKVLIVGEPGAGKSNLLLHAAQQLKDRYPSSWIVPLQFEDVSKQMKAGNVNKESLLKVMSSAVDIEKSPLAMTCLENAVFRQGNVFVLCDGFDEVCPRDLDTGLEVVSTITMETKVKALWLSSRQVAAKNLEACLGTKAITLEPFTSDEMVEFLTKYDVPSDKARTITDMVQRRTSDGKNPVSGCPLHLMMIKDLYLKGFPANGNILNEYELYKGFIDTKLEEYLNRTLTKKSSRRQWNNCKKVFIDLHKVCSIVALDFVNELPEEQRKLIMEEYDECQPDIKTGEEKTGIIDGSSADGRPQFVHRTFAEYFAALWLEENKNANLNFIGTITFDPHHKVLRSVFNRLLAKDCPFHRAVLDSDVSVVEEMLRQNADLKSRDAGGRTPLHLASLCGDSVDLLRMILNHGATLDLEMSDSLLNLTPLYCAVKAEFWDAVLLLIQKGAKVLKSISHDQHVKFLKKLLKDNNASLIDLDYEVNWPIFHDRKTVLHLAAGCAYANGVNVLLDNGANIDLKDIKGNTPLHDAISKGNIKIVQLLLERNANFQVTTTFGDSPLHLAVRTSKSSLTVKRLLDLGADIYAKNKNGDTPLHDAVRFGNFEIVMLLLNKRVGLRVKNRDGNTPLHLATSWNSPQNTAVVKALLEFGAVTAAVNGEGDTPLHNAISKCNKPVVEILLAHGAPTTTANKRGNTPLHIAAREQDVKVVELLLRLGASNYINAANKDGNTPLHSSVKYDNLEMVSILLKNGASVSVTNASKETPLHAAATHGNLKIVQLLLDWHASTSDVNNDQETPLHLAAKYSTPAVVKLILDTGARVDAVNKNGDTPLHVAIVHQKKSCKVIELLLENPVCVGIANNAGNTPLHIAVDKDKCQFVKLLLEKNAPLNVTNRHGDTPLSMARGEEIISLLQNHEAEGEMER